MKKIFFIAALFLTITSFSQTADEPIQIATSVQKISETEYDLIFTATLFKGWYLYSQYNPENASLPLEITLQECETGYTLVGKANEKKTFKKYSDTWEQEEVVFKDKAIITQRIQLTNKDITEIKLNFFGQVCETACININEKFTFSLIGKTIKEEIKIDTKSKNLTKDLHLNLRNTSLLKNDMDGDSKSSNGLFGIFLLGFVGGLLALLTPCVFPMIPLTVSFFTKQSKNKKKGIFNAILYGFFIVFIYIFIMSIR